VALLARALMIGGAAGLVMIAGQGLLFALGFWISPASAAVESLARDYMAVRIWSAPATIALYGVTGWLIAQERTRGVLAIQLVMNGMNIVLDVIFVLGFDWGVAGVAWATFLAEWTGLALGLWLCRDGLRDPALRAWDRVLDRTRLRRMAVVNGDIMIRSVALQAIFMSFLFFGAKFGDVQLAANQVLLQFLHLAAYALDGFAFAVETLVGQAMGARSRPALRRAAQLTSGWALGIAAVMALGFALFGPALIDLMSTAPDVRAAARLYIGYTIAATLIGLASFMLDGIFIGATRTTDMRNMMLVSAVIYFAAAFALMPSLGNHGLWLALLISYVARGLTLGLRYPALEAAAED
jgi:MATE family multidrug resistance protein